MADFLRVPRGYLVLLLLSSCFLLPVMIKLWRTKEEPLPFYPTLSADTPELGHAMSLTLFFTNATTEAEEVRALQELITWPEPKGNPTLASSTSPKNCEYRILQPKVNYFVGEKLEVFLTAMNHQKRPKSYGGDFFRAKLHSPSLKAGVTGLVRDHRNGTYTVSFQLLWAGKVEISIRLIHSSEAVQIIRKARDSRPDKVYFFGHFQRNGMAETTECNLNITDQPVCQYRDPRSGETWVCVRPSNLTCDSLVYHTAGGYRKVTNSLEDNLLKGELTDQVLPVLVHALHVLPRTSILDAKNLSACGPSLVVPQPSGFYYEDVWRTLACSHKTFATPPEASKCLKGKIIHMFGDSTLRQWWEYLLDFIPSVKKIDLHVEYKSGPLAAVDPSNGLILYWRAHGNPLRTTKTMIADLHYMSNDITEIGGGPDVVIVFTIWAHFTTYPVEVYIHRVRNIRKAVIDLLLRSPQTTVIIKTANTGYKSIYGSDWLTLQLDMILRKMFSELPVAIVDAWEMTSCHYLTDDIHPGRVIVQNEVDMFLSFICPQ
ncbi:NXPE family member 3-like [Ambystoma mexicanum]|uniref:NXPE family member 3-like n=1 Tax=Ambystoma mexicanum TaxID=8296 RepID=UPI0037E97504